MQGAGCKRQGAGGRNLASCILLYTRFFEFPVSRVVQVLLRVRERVPQAQLLVVGQGLFGEEKELFRLAALSGLNVAHHASGSTFDVSRSTDAIIYRGLVPRAALPTCFARATLAIYPFADTLVNRAKCPVKLTELLAAGVPVVAEAVGQNREYIRHGETGLLVPPGDVAAFSDAVTNLLENAQLRERLGRAAARDVRERFGWERLVETAERAYRAAE